MIEYFMKLEELDEIVDFQHVTLVVISKDSKLEESMALLNDDLSQKDFRVTALYPQNFKNPSIVNDANEMISIHWDSMFDEDDPYNNLTYNITNSMRAGSDLILIENFHGHSSFVEIDPNSLCFDNKKSVNNLKDSQLLFRTLSTGFSIAFAVDGRELEEFLITINSQIIELKDSGHISEDVSLILYANGQKFQAVN